MKFTNAKLSPPSSHLYTNEQGMGCFPRTENDVLLKELGFGGDGIPLLGERRLLRVNGLILMLRRTGEEWEVKFLIAANGFPLYCFADLGG